MAEISSPAAGALRPEPRSLARRLARLASARVGFWRAMLDMTLVVTGLVLICYPFLDRIPSPWRELVSYASLGLYCVAAWRLGPGAGGPWRRALRVALWLIIFGALNGALGWAVVTFLPWKSSFFGATLDVSQLPVGAYVLSTIFIVASLFLPVRLLLAIWALGRARLRWQLTFSYLLIGVLTTIFVPLALLGYIALISLTAVPALIPPDDLAPRLAEALGPAVRAGVSPGQLDGTMAGLLSGTTRLPLAEGVELADQTDLRAGGVRRLTLLGREGVVLAGAGEGAYPSAQPLPEPIADRLRLLIGAAWEGGACTDGNPASGPLPDTAACPILSDSGEPLALLLVESNLDGSNQVGAAIARIVTITLVGFSLLLNITILVVLAIVPVALGVGYLLARRLTRRIERLDQAAGSLAAGQLGQPVPIETQDEIGRLGETFNAMAAQLVERERALAEAAARSDALLRANKRLVADVSHELRNPLATLRGYIEALDQEHGDRLPGRDMRVIQAEVQRLSGLVDDLFTLARAEAQQLPLSVESVDAGALLRRLADTLAPLARREREIELVARAPAGLPAVTADPTRLEQALRNLAQNALRHTPPGGIIVLEAAAAGDWVELAVADTGVGIPPEDLPLVFERFYRGDSSRARETGGAGLGLALVRELVAAMGGEVAAESTPGRGSRFTIRLRRA